MSSESCQCEPWRQVLCDACACVLGVSSVFLVAVLVLLAANRLYVQRVDPVDAVALAALKEASSRHPRDEELKEAYRRVDRDIRAVFWTADRFERRGAWLAGAAALAMLLSLRGLLVFRVHEPRPGTDDEAALARDRSSRRWGLGAAAVAALILAAAGVVRLRGGGEVADKAEQAGVEAVADQDQETSGYASPTREEILREWPCFRGPEGIGVAHGASPPTAWDGKTGVGIRWKTTVPRPGYSSAVVWADRLFITGADKEARELYCFNAADGGLLWRLPAVDILGSPAQLPEVTADTGWAAPTAATDGRRVVAMFATGDVICADMAGARQWAVNLGVPENHYGHSSSPMIHGDKVLIQYDHSGGSRFLALDITSGEIAWERQRPVSVSWSSPIVLTSGTPAVAVLNAEPLVMAYHAVTGEELWRNECMGGEVGPSPAFTNGLTYVTTDYAVLAAIAVGGDTRGEVVWKTEEELPDVASPVAADGLLFVPTSVGTVRCYDAATGDVLWEEFFDKGFYASPVIAAGRVYMMNMDGQMLIAAAARTYRKEALCELGERGVSTPAVHGRRLYVRGAKSLFCIGE